MGIAMSDSLGQRDEALQNHFPLHGKPASGRTAETLLPLPSMTFGRSWPVYVRLLLEVRTVAFPDATPAAAIVNRGV